MRGVFSREFSTLAIVGEPDEVNNDEHAPAGEKVDISIYITR